MVLKTRSGISLSRVIDDPSLKEQLRCCLFFSFLFLFIAHSARYFNLAYTNDSLQIYQATDAQWQIYLGRWGQVLYCRLRGTIAAPYVIGLLSGLYISLAAFLIIRMFHIQEKAYIAVLCLFMTCNEALNSLNATFINSSDTIMLSMLLSVLSVYFWNKWRFGFFLSASLLTLSLSLYQADLQTAICLVLLILLILLLESRTVDKDFFIRGMKAVAFMIVGLLLYKLSLTIVSRHTQITTVEHLNNLFSDSFLSTLFPRMLRTWMQPFSFILNPHTLHPKCTTVFYFLLIAWTLILVLDAIFRVQIPPISRLISFLILLILPFGMNFSAFLQHSDCRIHNFRYCAIKKYGRRKMG